MLLLEANSILCLMMRELSRMRWGDDCSGSNRVANLRECLIVGIVVCHVVRDDTL